ncbi:NEQ196 [Nanoarchaeum equitans Kin4-M]|uniref:NEQ196 n=1 Tax=Nanoarchaeum equitans (strain Kin4-M) TaxID=228908 RepID=Q74MQ2_NANEQ|nr:NEQ196 [Nanoarchaeum equitans Kin4-M]
MRANKNIDNILSMGIAFNKTNGTNVPINTNKVCIKSCKNLCIIVYTGDSYRIITDNISKELKNVIEILSKYRLTEYIESIEIKELTLEDVFAYFVNQQWKE